MTTKAGNKTRHQEPQSAAQMKLRRLWNLTNKVSRAAEEHQSRFTYTEVNWEEDKSGVKTPTTEVLHIRQRELSHSPTGGAACSENKRSARTRTTCPPTVPLTNWTVLLRSSAAVGDAPTFARPPANELVCHTGNYSKYERKLYKSVEQKLTYWTELCFLL